MFLLNAIQGTNLAMTPTQEGREAAQARGVAFGRPGKLKPDHKNLARELVKAGQSISTVARTFNVHPATIYRCINEIQTLGGDTVPVIWTLGLATPVCSAQMGDHYEHSTTSYAQKLVTVGSGGILMLLDPVFELNPLNDLG